MQRNINWTDRKCVAGTTSSFHVRRRPTTSVAGLRGVGGEAPGQLPVTAMRRDAVS